MDRGSIVVLSLAVVAVGMAVTGSLTHARTPIEDRVIDRDVDLSGAARLMLVAGASDVHVTHADGGPGAHVHLKARGTHVSAITVDIVRRGDTAVVTINDAHRSATVVGIASSGVGADVTVRTPVAVDVLTGSGDVTASGMPRAFAGRTGSGDVTIDDPHGNVRAGTGTGDVAITVGAAFRGDEVAATTGTGDITVSVPHDFRASFDAHSQTGSVTDDVHLVQAGSPSIRLRSGTGDIRLAPAR